MRIIPLLSLLLSIVAYGGDPANDPVQSALFMDRSPPIANLVQGDGRGALRIICVNCASGIGGATAANQVIGNASLASIDSKLTAPLSVTGPLTDAQLRASAVSVSGNMGRTWNLSSGSDSVSASVSNFPAIQSVNLTQILSAAPSVTNWMPTRISNGSSYVDPTQIRALTSSDQITVANPTLAVTQSTSPWVTSRNWTLSSGTDSVSASVSNFPATQAVNQTQVNGVAVSVGSGVINTGVQRVVLPTDQPAIPVTQTTEKPLYELITLKNGASESLAVNGSVTPVDFSYTPAASEVRYISEITIFIQDKGTTDATSFGALAALTNGLQVTIQSNGTSVDLSNSKDNIALGLFFHEQTMLSPQTNGWWNDNDLFRGTNHFDPPIQLNNANADFIRARVRDNLSSIDALRIAVMVSRRL